MKIVIWVLCILVCSVVSVLIREAGIVLGGIPTALLGLALVFGPAPLLCRAWDKRKAKKAAIPEEKWYTCQKCGQLVSEGEVCDCAEAEELRKAEKLGMTVEQYRAFREDIESNVAEKRLRDAAKTSERRFPWGAVGYALLAAWIVVCFVMAALHNREPVYCSRCSSEVSEPAKCPCCYATICSSCLSDIESEHASLEEAGYRDGLNDGYNEAENSTPSDFLTEKAREQAEKIDEEYGPGAYGGTDWTFGE